MFLLAIIRLVTILSLEAIHIFKHGYINVHLYDHKIKRIFEITWTLFEIFLFVYFYVAIGDQQVI